MTEPLNYEGPLAADVVQRVSDFLLKPVHNETGGWTDVSKDDWNEVWGIFQDILDAKFERDSDGDHTIEFELCHRQNGRMDVVHVPYSLDTDADMEKAVHAIRMASGIIERMSNSIGFKIADKRRADARKKQFEPIIGFLASNGHIRAHDRVKDFRDGQSLFIGKDDDVWACLGLTCAELRDTQGDRHDRNGGVEGLLLRATKAMGG